MKWVFEPGHSAAEFCARHMMVTLVRGSFKNIHGTLDFDPQHPQELAVEASIEAATCCTGEPVRDDHLRSSDFLSCDDYPTIHYRSTAAVLIGPEDYRISGELTIRDVTRPVSLDVRYLGMWETPWWEDGVDKGPKQRAGFTARSRINRYDFGVSWNGALPHGGVVVSPEIDLVLDVEGILV